MRLHACISRSREDWIVEGEPEVWHDFEAARGLDALRELGHALDPASDGIRLIGSVGFTSHVADVIRKAGIVARVEGARAA